MSPSLCLGGPVASPGLGSNERGFSKGEHSLVETFHKLVSFLQTWMTYSWSLSWANVDKAFLVEQETKAGFWNKDIQVSWSKIQNIPILTRSSTTVSSPTIQERSGVLTSRTGTPSAARGRTTGALKENDKHIWKCWFFSGKTKKSLDTPWVSVDY